MLSNHKDLTSGERLLMAIFGDYDATEVVHFWAVVTVDPGHNGAPPKADFGYGLFTDEMTAQIHADEIRADFQQDPEIADTVVCVVPVLAPQPTVAAPADPNWSPEPEPWHRG